MLIDIQEIIKQRLEAFQKNPEAALKVKGTEYNKSWNAAVDCFKQRINKDKKKEKLPETSFIAVRQKLAGIKEIDDLRWFYGECLKYSYTRDKITRKRNTFSRCFYGALDVKKIRN